MRKRERCEVGVEEEMESRYEERYGRGGKEVNEEEECVSYCEETKRKKTCVGDGIDVKGEARSGVQEEEGVVSQVWRR